MLNLLRTIRWNYSSAANCNNSNPPRTYIEIQYFGKDRIESRHTPQWHALADARHAINEVPIIFCKTKQYICEILLKNPKIEKKTDEQTTNKPLAEKFWLTRVDILDHDTNHQELFPRVALRLCSAEHLHDVWRQVLLPPVVKSEVDRGMACGLIEAHLGQDLNLQTK